MIRSRGKCRGTFGGPMMKFALAGGLLAALATAAAAVAQPAAPGPFKLGTFERQGRTFVGIVVADTRVIDFAAAHAAPDV